MRATERKPTARLADSRAHGLALKMTSPKTYLCSNPCVAFKRTLLRSDTAPRSICRSDTAHQENSAMPDRSNSDEAQILFKITSEKARRGDGVAKITFQQVTDPRAAGGTPGLPPRVPA